jgi:hypothetical protein
MKLVNFHKFMDHYLQILIFVFKNILWTILSKLLNWYINMEPFYLEDLILRVQTKLYQC